MTTGIPPHVVVIGGGIAGLAAARFLADVPVRVTVLEGAPRIGGKLSASDVAGVSMDEGAEALLARRPEGISLIEATGLGTDLVPAGVTSSAIYTRGAMRSLPRRQFMGVPADIDELAATGVISNEGIARARDEAAGHLDAIGRFEAAGPLDAADASVTEYIGKRLGVEVVDRLVDPLLGGVYAGRSEDLSFQATLAPLAAAARKHATLTEASASLLPPAPAPASAPTSTSTSDSTPTSASAPASASDSPPASTPMSDNSKKPSPIFVTLTTGLGALPQQVANASEADIRVNAMVRELHRTATGWRLTIGSAADPEYLDADAVILATPAAPAARLLKGTVGAAAAQLEQIPYASMAIITLAFAAGDFPAQQRSGYLVPAVDGRAVKAVTFSTVKWPHLAKAAADAGSPVHIVRCSVGRSGDVAVLQRDDKDLAALAADELAGSVGLTAAPVAYRITRWGGGLPQYNVGHLDRVARIRAAVAAQPGLAVAGAAYDGVGIPACIATARSAADQIIAHLTAAGAMSATRPGA
jgi:oxygen-dependent protoporphyrinogen oxidase